MNPDPVTRYDLPDAEAQCVVLADLIRPHLSADTVLVGIHSGGVWVARRLHDLLAMTHDIGLIDVSFYRDDYGERGLHARVKPSSIPFDIEARRVILVDDVLYTGRTTRAAINELFDYGRPASVELAVLADRGERELPVAPTYCPWTLTLAPGESLVLARGDDGRLSWRLEHA